MVTLYRRLSHLLFLHFLFCLQPPPTATTAGSGRAPLDPKHKEKSSSIPRFTEPISNITVTSGREAVLACLVENLRDYQVAWVRVDTQTILTIHKHIISRNYRIYLRHTDDRAWFLHIESAQESDRGWYMCQINTDPMLSQKGHLEVVVPPDIIDSETSKDMTIRENSNVTLTCVASGYPLPSILWRREDNLPIASSSSKASQVAGQRLVLQKVAPYHAAAYLCIASNGVPPSKSKRISLLVHFKPVIKTLHKVIKAVKGQDAVLVCQVEAYPQSENHWASEHHGLIISETERPSHYQLMMADNDSVGDEAGNATWYEYELSKPVLSYRGQMFASSGGCAASWILLSVFWSLTRVVD